jgi:hypothetical protein
VQEAHPLLWSLGPVALAVAIGSATGEAAISGGPTEAQSVEVAVKGVVGWDALIQVLHVLVNIPERASSATVVFDGITVKEPDSLIV